MKKKRELVKMFNQFSKEFTELVKKWSAENKLDTSVICSVAIYGHIPVPKEVSDGDKPMTVIFIDTTQIKNSKNVSFDSHARTLSKYLKESYGDESDEE